MEGISDALEITDQYILEKDILPQDDPDNQYIQEKDILPQDDPDKEILASKLLERLVNRFRGEVQDELGDLKKNSRILSFSRKKR